MCSHFNNHIINLNHIAYTGNKLNLNKFKYTYCFVPHSVTVELNSGQSPQSLTAETIAKQICYIPNFKDKAYLKLRLCLGLIEYLSAL